MYRGENVNQPRNLSPADARGDHGKVDRFGYIPVGMTGLGDPFDIVVAGHQQHLYIMEAVVRLYLVAKVFAADLVHGNIKEHHVRLMKQHLFEAIDPIAA